MKNKKILKAAGLLALVVVLSISAISAYLTDTESATNVFTVGKVDIELTEPNWKADDAKNFTPNKNIAKDPTITVKSDSQPAYIFAKVTIPQDTHGNAVQDVFTTKNAAKSGPVESGWVEVSNTVTGGNRVIVYGYGSTTAMTEVAAGTSQKLFSSITMNDFDSGELDAAQYDVIVDSYAIQTTDLKNGDTAITAPADIYAALLADLAESAETAETAETTETVETEETDETEETEEAVCIVTIKGPYGADDMVFDIENGHSITRAKIDDTLPHTNWKEKILDEYPDFNSVYFIGFVEGDEDVYTEDGDDGDLYPDEVVVTKSMTLHTAWHVYNEIG